MGIWHMISRANEKKMTQKKLNIPRASGCGMDLLVSGATAEVSKLWQWCERTVRLKHNSCVVFLSVTVKLLPSMNTVEDWLRSLYCHHSLKRTGAKQLRHASSLGELPIFERNRITNDVLSELQSANLSATRHAEEEIKIMKVLSEEFSAEDARLNKILEALQLDAKSVPAELADLVQTMSVSLQQAQQLEDTNDDFYAAPIDVSFDQTVGLQRLQNLEKIQESLSLMQQTDNYDQLAKKQETEFLSKKSNEYAGHIRHLEKKLEAVSCHPEIRHRALERRAKQLKAANEKLSQIRSKLSVYSDLTPDINLARLQVQNLKDELEEMEKEITHNISSINAN